MTARDPWEDEEEEEFKDPDDDDEPEVDEDDEELGTGFGIKPILAIEDAAIRERKLKAVKRQLVFLQQLVRTASVTEAASLAGYKDARAVYAARQKDKEFAAAWELAVAAAGDMLEQEAIRRAMHGVDKPVFYQGMECGTIREYSDSLMKQLLKRFKPEEYSERSQVTTNTTVRVGIAILPGKVKADSWEQRAAVVHANQKPIMIEGDKVVDVTPEKGHGIELER